MDVLPDAGEADRGFIGGMPAYEEPKLSADGARSGRRGFGGGGGGRALQWIAAFRIDAIAVHLLVLDTRGPRYALLSSLLLACRQT